MNSSKKEKDGIRPPGRMFFTWNGLAIALILSIFAITMDASPSRPQLELNGTAASVRIDLAGGSMADFHLSSNPLNPFSWNHPEPGDTDPRGMGHFICFDRWGPSSENEEKNGMVKHGEASRVLWSVTQKPEDKDGYICAEVQCELPVAGMTMTRSLVLNKERAVCKVTEAATNTNKLGRLYNLVQHATMGPPFLDESMMVDTNATKGFCQDGEVATIEDNPSSWPEFSYKGKQYDLRYMKGDIGPAVTSFIFGDNEEYGWITTANPSKGILVGYFWKTADYPWLNLYRDPRHGELAAFGIEFGTTGLHQPYKVLVEKGEIFGRQLYEYIDADETLAKSYTAFIVEIPDDFKGVASMQISDDRITLKEHGTDDPRIVNLKLF